MRGKIFAEWRAGVGRLGWGLFLVLGMVTASTVARCDDDAVVYSMQRVRAHSSPHLPENLLSQLQPVGYRVLGESSGVKSEVCEVFWAKSIRTEASRPASGLLYGNLKEGSLIGVVHFFYIQKYVRDYRAQTIRPGYFTLRYAVMPKGSDDKEPRDFVLLTPVGADRSPERVLPITELVHRSRLASAAHVPVAMSLVAIDPDEALPSLVSDEEGTSVLQVKLRSAATPGKKAQDVPVALVVVTAIPEDLGD